MLTNTAATAIYTLSLHDALPICKTPYLTPEDLTAVFGHCRIVRAVARSCPAGGRFDKDRKSTRLNSSHSQISYAVFCLKKKTSNEENGAAAVGCCFDHC